jgi:hypothetical protein
MDIEVVRKYATARVNAESLRRVARSIGGLSSSGVDMFIRGAKPQARVRGLLCAWYLREHREPQAGSPPPPAEPPHLLDGLLGGLTGVPRMEARMRIVSALADAYRRSGDLPPEWLYERR